MHGEPVTIEGTELLARCVQHETDHLDGILFIDRLDRAQRKLAIKAIREAEWAGETAPPSSSRRTPCTAGRSKRATSMRLVFAGTPESPSRRSTPCSAPPRGRRRRSPGRTRRPAGAARVRARRSR